MVREHWRIGVPVGLYTWHELINTDDAVYGGSGVTNGPLHSDVALAGRGAVDRAAPAAAWRGDDRARTDAPGRTTQEIAAMSDPLPDFLQMLHDAPGPDGPALALRRGQSRPLGASLTEDAGEG